MLSGAFLCGVCIFSQISVTDDDDLFLQSKTQAMITGILNCVKIVCILDYISYVMD